MNENVNQHRQAADFPAPINPVVVATKLAAIANLEHPELFEEIGRQPRLVELLWFIQWLSMQAGGLVKFVQDFVARCAERLRTPTMFGAARKGGQLSLEQKLKIWHEIPPDARPSGTACRFESWLDKHILAWDHTPEEIEDLVRRDRLQLENALKRVELAAFESCCREAACKSLPYHLAALCNEIGTGFGSPWYFHDLTGALFEAMDNHTRETAKRLAMTVVAQQVFEAIDYALGENIMVRVEGDSRFGKTESGETRCLMQPGLLRLVRVPPSNGLWDLIRNFADGLGVPYTPSTNRNKLRADVEFVLRFGQLGFVLDEAAWLLPQAYGDTTAPARLNWLRAEVVDRKRPLILLTTPQSFHTGLKKFIKRTGYNFEQFIGRNFLTYNLPTDLDDADLYAVARLHFPEFDEAALEGIVGAAMSAECYLKAVEMIATRARFLARREGRGRLTLKLIGRAIQEVVPGAATRENLPEAEPVPERARTSRPSRTARTSPPEIDSVPQTNRLTAHGLIAA